MFSEDEAEGYVQAAHGKEEKCGDEREFANVVGEDRCPDAKRAIPHSSSVPTSTATRGGRDCTYSAWKIPSGPRPNWEPRTGKKRTKKAIGHEISEKRRKTSWKIMKRRLTTAQKAPAAWLGTVLLLKDAPTESA
jgi:hypothetical protein